jgi:hypothetical protein
MKIVRKKIIDMETFLNDPVFVADVQKFNARIRSLSGTISWQDGLKKRRLLTGDRRTHRECRDLAFVNGGKCTCRQRQIAVCDIDEVCQAKEYYE